MVVRTFLVVVLAVIVFRLSEIDAASEDVCGCEAVEIVTTTDVVLRKHGQLLGRYQCIIKLPVNNLQDSKEYLILP